MLYGFSHAVKRNQPGQTGRLLYMILCLMMFVSLTVSAKAEEAFVPVSASVIGVDQFGDVMLDLKEIDLEYGDSVNVSFSGGYEIKKIPYYSDFYGFRSSVVISDQFDTICLGGIGYNFNNSAGIKEGETARITLEQKGRYKKEYEAYNINDARIRMEDQSDQEFLNFREITAGQIKGKRLYRGPSPFDPEFHRVELMEQYIREKNIKCVLDLADNQEKLKSYNNLPDYTSSMISNGQVIPCAIGVDYLEPKAMDTLGRGLAEMTEKDGPYLIQCSFGRDRTGVICAVIESLCGAEYQEIIEDYMLSYDMLHSINMNPESLQYKLFKHRIDELLGAVFGIDTAKLPESDLQTSAADYLKRCGMTQEQVEKLKDKLTRD